MNTLVIMIAAKEGPLLAISSEVIYRLVTVAEVMKSPQSFVGETQLLQFVEECPGFLWVHVNRASSKPGLI